MDLATVDVVDPDVYRSGPPYDTFALLRREAPVFRQRIADPALFDECWVVTRHEDVRTISREPETFSSAGGVHLRRSAAHHFRPNMINMDDPGHRRNRKLVAGGFTPRVLRTFEDHYRAMAAGVLERALVRDTFDFVAEVAAELPLLAICELVGAPVEDRGRILAWSNAILTSEDPDYSGTPEAFRAAVGEMVDYAGTLWEWRRREPGHDLVSELAAGDGETLTREEFDGLLLLLLGAGNETTRNNLSAGLLALIEHPDQWEVLCADPDGCLAGAVEEVTRWASPVNYMARTVTCDTEFAGQPLAAGDKVAMFYSSANRDEEIFPEASRFDVLRDPNPHVGFGFGAHFCLGANLARIETRAVLEELIPRVRTVELAGPVRRARSSFINGIKELPVRVTPR